LAVPCGFVWGLRCSGEAFIAPGSEFVIIALVSGSAAMMDSSFIQCCFIAPLFNHRDPHIADLACFRKINAFAS
jgi:hypothetical protein